MTHLGATFYSQDELAAIPFASLGRNVLIKRTAGLFFTENIAIGDNSRIDDFSIIVASGKPVTLGRNVHIASHCYISGSHGFTAEDFTGLAPGVKIFTSSDDYTGHKMTNPTLPRDLIGGPSGEIILGRHVILGTGSVVLPGCSIGEGSSVGALSVVTRPLGTWGVFAGQPARLIKPRAKDLLALEQELYAREAREAAAHSLIAPSP